MNSAIESIATLPGVGGAIHHRRDLILSHRLPADLLLHSAVALCTAVSRAFAAYAGAGRVLREAWFEFPALAVLVVVGPAESPDEFLTLLVRDRNGVAAIVQAAAAFWK